MSEQEKLKEKLEKMPNIETKTKLSADGKWVINQTIITSIKSLKYYQKIVENVKDIFNVGK